jgi:pimeloyl-ACP methyl ester carboxylesterase
MFSPPVVATPNPTIKALSDLAGDLNGAVLLSHSQSGTWGFEAVLANPKGISGIVAIEPTAPTCSGSYTEQQIAALAQVPTLVIFGDHLDVTPTFTTALAACRALIAQIKAKGGNAQTLHLPDVGIHGNSHMMMMDANNIQIADLILKWIDRNVRPQ